MKIEDVVKLLDKGFSKEEIMNFEKSGEHETPPEPEKKPEQETPPEPEKKPEQEKPPEPEKKPEQDETGKRLDSIEATMNKLLKAVQISNLHKDSTGGNMPDLERETDKIMAGIIRPEQKG